jgi:hypothetical protein
MEIIKKIALLIFALLLKNHLSYGQMNYEVIIDCDTTTEAIFCSVAGTVLSSYNYSDSIRDLAPEVSVIYEVDSLCNKKVLKTEIANKFKYTAFQLNYISKYYEKLVKNANIAFRTKNKQTLGCKLVSSIALNPMKVKFSWR